MNTANPVSNPKVIVEYVGAEPLLSDTETWRRVRARLSAVEQSRQEGEK